MPSADTTAPASAAHDTLSCVIVEDQAMFLDLLAGMMSLLGGIRVVAQAHDVAAGLAACELHRPDVLILDLWLPGGDGVEVARRLIEINPACRVIAVSGHARDFVCPAWLIDHLQAVISKNEAFGSLRRELDELVAGEAEQENLLNRAALPLSLTAREAKIFNLIGRGLSTKAIAEQLALSRHTVQSHRKRIAIKLGTTGNELTRRAIAHQVEFFED